MKAVGEELADRIFYPDSEDDPPQQSAKETFALLEKKWLQGKNYSDNGQRKSYVRVMRWNAIR